MKHVILLMGIVNSLVLGSLAFADSKELVCNIDIEDASNPNDTSGMTTKTALLNSNGAGQIEVEVKGFDITATAHKNKPVGIQVVEKTSHAYAQTRPEGDLKVSQLKFFVGVQEANISCRVREEKK